ncbi:hypothetical protein QLL95_gp0162 [Cotonvirus japonicus]|uniref:DNA-directed RNA polymerase n=1 Tax=Cotonvirus japonicus TaxID=2811091 RepID=A0ABM7NR67_9VIRU|nr:hypothetical protein QLL95_gp0162 [Cotonvirus japonicus]BCS82651.1 hypothetical protein [Cotonvirus japonicus]
MFNYKMSINNDKSDYLSEIITTINKIHPIDPDILKKDDIDLFDLMMPIAKSAGMGWYYEQLQQECQEKSLKNKVLKNNDTNMFNILNANIPGPEEVIVINVTSGRDRRAFYTWADYHRLRHCACKIKLFEPCYLYQCDECGQASYEDEVRYNTDWSTINPGVSYGEFIECPNMCDTYYHTKDSHGDPDCDFKRKKVFNAVIIGKTLPLIPKSKTKRMKNVAQKRNIDMNILKQIPVRDFKIMSISNVEKYYESDRDKSRRNNNLSFRQVEYLDNKTINTEIETIIKSTSENKSDDINKSKITNTEIETIIKSTIENKSIDTNKSKVTIEFVGENKSIDKFNTRSNTKGTVGHKIDHSSLNDNSGIVNDILINNRSMLQRMTHMYIFDQLMGKIIDEKKLMNSHIDEDN